RGRNAMQLLHGWCVWSLIWRIVWISLQQPMRFKYVRSHKVALCDVWGTFLLRLCKTLRGLWLSFFTSRRTTLQERSNTWLHTLLDVWTCVTRRGCRNTARRPPRWWRNTVASIWSEARLWSGWRGLGSFRVS